MKTPRLRLRPSLRPVEMTDGGLLLLGEGEHYLLDTPLQQRLIPLLRAGADHLTLANTLMADWEPLMVFYAVEQLLQRGLLETEAPSAAPANTQALDLVTLAGRDPEPLATLLRASGIPMGTDASIRLLLVDSYLNPDIPAQAQACREQAITLIPLAVGHGQIWLGPALTPEGKPCWKCLQQRLWDNHPVENLLRRRGQTIPPLPQPPTGAWQRAAGLLLLLLPALNSEDGRLYRFLAGDPELHRHGLLSNPQCPVCGEAPMDDPQSTPILQSRPVNFAVDGGYRLEDPSRSFARLAQRVDPITGLITRLGPLPQRDRPGRPVYAATHPLHPLAQPGHEDFQQISLGKGQTPEQARMSAMGEALERWSARFREDTPVHRASLQALGDSALAPAELLNFSDTQYARRDTINAALDDPRQQIPRPYPPEATLDWSRAWSLRDQCWRYLPAGFCYSQYPEEEDYCRFSSNGHAAGNCLEEAILQGFLELVERDAVAIWWYNRVSRPALDLGSLDHPYPSQLLADYQRLGWRLWCLDLTTDLGIPVVVALAEGPEPGLYYLGFGCHLEPQLALLRALTELNQLFDPEDPGSYPWDPTALDTRGFLYPAAGAPLPLETLPTSRFDDLREAVRHCATQAASLGLDTLVVDQTRPEAGLCAVKVVVPGLRHFWPRLGPGRLYQVPVKLGWRPSALPEAALNPLGLYL